MTQHAITLTTQDGQRISFTGDENTDLLASAQVRGILLPSLCRGGGCGICLCTVVGGDYRQDSDNATALPPGADERGDVLLCVTYPLGDLALKAPYAYEHVRFEAPKTRPAEIVELAAVADNTVRLLLRLLPDQEGGQAAEFEPGQYMNLEVPGSKASRAYSLANTANWSGELEFLIRLHPGGVFSQFLEHDATVGQHLEVEGPLGHFTLQGQSLRPRWFVGGGTGLAPLLSMLRHMAEFQETQPARLYFGVNRETELVCLDELKRLAAELPQLQITLCVWRPEGGWDGFVGTPVDALRRDLERQDGAMPDLYLCGPPALINGATEAALAFGIGAEHIFSERFSPS
ncbi:2Fe-2S iron-sulfur cluster binding domain-containing protein [Methylomagnum sp.]